MKGDWIKMYSETLKQEIAFDKNSGYLFCRDGTQYTPKELDVIREKKRAGVYFPLSVHIVKGVFKGEVVK